MVATYEVFAIRYAHLERTARHNFLGGDEHDGPMPLDYYVWAIVDAERTAKNTIIVDTGFDHESARRRGRQIVRPVAEGLEAIGISPDKVEHIVISHMHYDHAEITICSPRRAITCRTRRWPTAPAVHAGLRVGGVSMRRVAAMVHKVFAGRVQFHDGDDARAGHHRAQGRRPHARHAGRAVSTRRGWVVLGSDTAHFYANLEPGRPFPIVDKSAGVRRGAATALRLASSPQHFIPGHDPLVLAALPVRPSGTRGRGAPSTWHPRT